MSIKVVTDSTCDLPASLAREYDISVIPCFINMGDESYLDGIELSREEFYARLPDYDPPPTTSAPGIGTFVDKYRQLIAEGASEIISVHLAARLSNVVNVARLAGESITDVPVHVIDSGQLTIGTGLLALEAAQAAEAGRNVEDILILITAKAKRIYTIAALDTLEYLRRSGRLSRFQALMGAVMRVKPLLTVYNGTIHMERVRTRKKAIGWLLEKLDDLRPVEQLVLLHTHATEEIEALWQQIQPRFPELPRPWFLDVTTAIGAHLGPAGVGFTCVTASEEGTGE